MPHIKYNSIPISPEWPWIKPSQFAKLKGLSAGYVRKLCREGKIPGGNPNDPVLAGTKSTLYKVKP